MRVRFRNLLALARRGRTVNKAIAVGSIPPELRGVWNRLENEGVAVLLAGDGSGFADGAGFHADLKRMHDRGWRVEILSWRHGGARRMREWVEKNGRFIALDDHYENVTFLEGAPPGQ